MAEKNPTYNFWKISPVLFSIICFFLAIIIPFEKKKDMVKYVEKTYVGSSQS